MNYYSAMHGVDVLTNTEESSSLQAGMQRQCKEKTAFSFAIHT